MGTKNDPGEFDCYAHALPDEPMFVLLARDPDFYRLVSEWATTRQRAINCGDRPEEDRAVAIEAQECAAAGARWRKENFGRWRIRPKPTIQELEAILAEPDLLVSILPDGSIYVTDDRIGKIDAPT